MVSDRWQRRITSVLAAAIFGLGSAPVRTSHRAFAFTPESREVKHLIDGGLKFLESADDSRLGGACLIGMAFLKTGADQTHPKVADAVRRCQQAAKVDPNAVKEDIYSTGVAVIFLCEVDPSEHRVEIETLLRSLELRQKPHGGWGYPTRDTGDTSMTQYGVLGTWTASRSGIEVSLHAAEQVCHWLLRTQDPSGGWGYQGKDPGGANFKWVKQDDVRQSLSAAGAGSVYILADLLGLIDVNDQPQDTGLPVALKPVQERQPGKRALTNKVDVRLVRRAVKGVNLWFARNYRIDPPQWTHYYLYALERYQSFRELAQGRAEKEPGWYNDGVRFLAGTQHENGSWKSNAGAAVDTAFAILFLTRSTQKTIEESAKNYGEGTLVGGRGIPSNTGKVYLNRGRVVSQPLAGPAEELLEMLNDPDHPDFEQLAGLPGEQLLSDDETIRGRQTARLRQLAKAKPYETRLAVVQTLARTRDLDHVPVLIHALSDPDWRVAKQGRDGLRFISRKFTGFGLPDRPTDEQRLTAIANWKDWYVSIRPDALLLD